jgi:hypothetical protein
MAAGLDQFLYGVIGFHRIKRAILEKDQPLFYIPKRPTPQERQLGGID